MNQINCSFNDFFEFSYFDNFFKMISLFTEGYINKIINTVPDFDLVEYHSKTKAIDSNRFSSRLSKECFEKSLKIKFNYGENKEKLFSLVLSIILVVLVRDRFIFQIKIFHLKSSMKIFPTCRNGLLLTN